MLTRLLGASALAVVIVGGGVQASAQTRLAATALPQTRAPLPKGAHLIGALPATATLPLSVLFKPRHAAVLARLALRHGEAPLPLATIRAMFDPTSGQVAAVRRYFEAHGFVFQSSAGLAMSFTATPPAVHRALGVTLKRYRTLSGRVFHAPAGVATLPATIEPWVESIGGLSTAAAARPLLHRRARLIPRASGRSLAGAAMVSAQAVTPSCTGAKTAQANYGGLLPGQLASAGG